MGFETATLQDLFSLEGKVALVTGGAGHLGRPMSEALAELGARVVVASRNIDNCRAVAEALGDGHLALPLDISSADSIRATVAEVIEQMSRVDVLVNNAYSGPMAFLDDATEDDFAESLCNGVTSYFVAAQACWRFMREHGGGSIINIASMYGMVGSYPEAYEGTEFGSPPNYHAAKGAVIHLTRHLAVYWAKDGVRVNAISPGPFPRPDQQGELAKMVARLETKSPMARMGKPVEMKGAAALLASEAGSYITGQNVVVDGGWTAW
ncbi:MAG TPA: SDR family oxidoreductase [Armatimonadota bacterium]|nr:SDR family oxidoreductase [Armatimonadota bacterium]